MQCKVKRPLSFEALLQAGIDRSRLRLVKALHAANFWFLIAYEIWSEFSWSWENACETGEKARTNRNLVVILCVDGCLTPTGKKPQ